jgi:hypothetical protein
MPARYVRPYSKGQKNDFRDAEAIAEAVQRPTMKFVATKTVDHWTFMRCTAYENVWLVSAPASSTRSAPFYWNVALLFGKDCASCAPSFRNCDNYSVSVRAIAFAKDVRSVSTINDPGQPSTWANRENQGDVTRTSGLFGLNSEIFAYE